MMHPLAHPDDVRFSLRRVGPKDQGVIVMSGPVEVSMTFPRFLLTTLTLPLRYTLYRLFDGRREDLRMRCVAATIGDPDA